MKERVRFPLLAKMMLWLLVHLLVLAAAFFAFVAWQLQLGLDSFLSGAAGDRLKGVGEVISSELRESPRHEWSSILARHEESLGVQVFLDMGREGWIGGQPDRVPPNVEERIKNTPRPQPLPPRGPGRPPGPPGPAGGRGPLGDAPPPDETDREDPPRPVVEPVFLLRGEGGDGYWAGIDLPLFRPKRAQPLHGLLVLRSQDLAGGGLFFDLRPWILGGLAVLAISLVLWVPFFFGITRFLSRLSGVTESIAEGKFDVKVGSTRSDELGHLGVSIESMATRLDRLVRGQKRFLGDVAHELCSPLARIQTGLGVLEYGLSGDQQRRLESIEEDVTELSRLVSELLAFTKASTAAKAVKLEAVELAPVVELAIARECPGQLIELAVSEGLSVQVDRNLLSRAIANVLRNARTHGGDDCTIRIAASRAGKQVELRIADNGPGVAAADLPRLFEPFYRPDASRTRETGGAGLGLAIVLSGVEACGGSVRAENSPSSGLVVVFNLPRGAY
ncbi:sensor histidine kinase [Luteolibacter marinus]|uniref:sensor histidine kinase n=1 Tax=Luteolibacter marinus TaxID=2776705 RepID=UPI0018660FDC|nr:HAMP domain-containing sensor histidine kinase [Luteolibacter marinus]